MEADDGLLAERCLRCIARAGRSGRGEVQTAGKAPMRPGRRGGARARGSRRRHRRGRRWPPRRAVPSLHRSCGPISARGRSRPPGRHRCDQRDVEGQEREDLAGRIASRIPHQREPTQFFCRACPTMAGEARPRALWHFVILSPGGRGRMTAPSKIFRIPGPPEKRSRRLFPASPDTDRAPRFPRVFSHFFPTLGKNGSFRRASNPCNHLVLI